ncbi:lantibiotic dehydratase family protein [Thermobifida alba]|uniref:lantibiotic dehydratase family protein n=1 Tax=Thermobifida alba TaxID=53522 RepID=UPI003CC58A18
MPRQRAWIADVWARKDVRDALAAASPALCRQVEAVVSGACTEPRRVRRTVLSLVSYLLRWQRRATPFGLFAGVAPVGTAHEPSVAWGGKHQVSARPDGEWLTDVISRLDQCRELRERLHVVANDTGQARGDRFVAPGPPADGRARHMAPLEVSVRRTRPVAAALEEARTPIRYGELCARLARLFPTAGEDRIRAVLDGLIDQNLLVSSLWPPMTCLDTLGYVCAELDAVRAQGIDAIAPLVAELRTIRDDLAERSPGALAESSRDSVVERLWSCDPQPPRRVAATRSRTTTPWFCSGVAILSHPGGWLPHLSRVHAASRCGVAILSHPGGWLPQHLKCANTTLLGDAHDSKKGESSQADTNLLENPPVNP